MPADTLAFGRYLSFPRMFLLVKAIHGWLRRLASLRVTLVLLVALAVLLFWGTLYQSLAGVDVGTARFFDSWFVWVLGVLPIPALKMILVFSAVNLVCALFFRTPRRIESLGLYLIHGGLLFLIAGSFIADIFRESNDVYVLDGDAAARKNRFARVLKPGSYEIALADSLSYPVERWEPQVFSLGSYDFKILEICKDALFDIEEESSLETLPKNSIGFPAKMSCVEKGENERPGVILLVRHQGWKQEERIMLSIMDSHPLTLAGGETIRLSFAEDRLPFSVTVLSADSVGADVSVNVGGAILPRRIALNSPLKISPYAIYFGGVTAVMPQVNLVRFVVRRDYFAFVPYVFSLLTGLGMCLHFGFMLLRHCRESR